MQVEEAVESNARWCDLMCGVHGSAGVFHDTAWVHPGEVPPFHSNIIMRRHDEIAAAAHIASVRRLGPWSIKDSFGRLDLGPAGFDVLFEANWIGARRRACRPSGIRWTAIKSDRDLAMWECCWASMEVHESLHRRQFPPALLEVRDVHFLAGWERDTIEHVAIIHRTGHVAGLSNAFSPRRSFDWSGCLDAAWRRVGDVPLVGYERGADLERALDSGFEALGPLCIWERRGATP